ncbi:Hypothetical protein A7982_04595 [Minicystis rosea]|nr:Hypothetical protein A7982_04595 [Minicystis rosea]
MSSWAARRKARSAARRAMPQTAPNCAVIEGTSGGASELGLRAIVRNVPSAR